MFEFCGTRRTTARLLADHISLNENSGMIHLVRTSEAFWGRNEFGVGCRDTEKKKKEKIFGDSREIEGKDLWRAH